MGTHSKLILLSRNTATDRYICTWEITIPKCFEAQLNKHRQLVFCWNSDRFTPMKRVREQVLNDPYKPDVWGQNKPGMVSTGELSPYRAAIANFLWNYLARWSCVATHWLLEKLGVHKQWANRVLAPWRYQKGTVTAHHVSNLFNLRAMQSDPQPEVRNLVWTMMMQYTNTDPQDLEPGQYHLPYLTDDEKCLPIGVQIKASVARCGRVGRPGRHGIKSDLELVDTTFLPANKPPHLTPFEHVAIATVTDSAHGIYVGWQSAREFIHNQAGDFQSLQRGAIGPATHHD